MIEQNKVYGLLGLAAKSGKIVCGMDAVMDTINYKKAKLVIVANDASEKTKENAEYICNKNKIRFLVFGNKDALSHAIGKSNKVIFAIKDLNFVKGIYKIIYGGDAVE